MTVNDLALNTALKDVQIASLVFSVFFCIITLIITTGFCVLIDTEYHDIHASKKASPVLI